VLDGYLVYTFILYLYLTTVQNNVLNSVGDVPRIVLTFPIQQEEGRLPLQSQFDDVTLHYAVLPPADPEVMAGSLQSMRDYVT
jgi:hypothetical protein